MKQLTLEHAEAVSAAKLNMIRASDRAEHPKYKQHIEMLIGRLSEVHWWILNGIYRPGLQFNEEPPMLKSNTQKESKGDGPTAE